MNMLTHVTVRELVGIYIIFPSVVISWYRGKTLLHIQLWALHGTLAMLTVLCEKQLCEKRQLRVFFHNVFIKMHVRFQFLFFACAFLAGLKWTGKREKIMWGFPMDQSNFNNTKWKSDVVGWFTFTARKMPMSQIWCDLYSHSHFDCWLFEYLTI